MKIIYVALVLLLYFAAYCDDEDVMVCSYLGHGKDCIHDIYAMANCYVQIDSPADITRVIVSNPSGFYLRQSGHSIYLQTKTPGARGLLYLLTAEGNLFGLNVIDKTMENDGSFVKKVVIVKTARKT